MRTALGKTLRKALTTAVKGLRQFAYSYPVPARPAAGPPVHRRVGLALGGGFARGLAHIGVLKVLTENRIPIDALAGTSVGSIIAAAFACGMTVEQMADETQQIRWKSFARWTVDRLGLATNERMEGLLKRVISCARFEDLRLPLAIVAADLSTGQAVTFRRGELIPPLRASCSFPGLFIPIDYQGRLLVDGAIVGSVPVGALRELGVDIVVGVHLKANGPRHRPTNIFQVIGQSFQIAQSLNDPSWKRFCNVIIEPDTASFTWDDFGRAEELMREGERAARAALPALRAVLESQTTPIPRPALAR
jgi:NTE family protein